MVKIRLFVGLKIPDNTAITAFHTLERLGYNELKKLEREDFYEFKILTDEEKFIENITKVDILVNSNKHYSKILKENQEDFDDEYTYVLVKDKENTTKSLFSTLRERMGFIHLNEMSKGILWKMGIDAENKEKKKEIAENITRDLLFNEHYQEFEILR